MNIEVENLKDKLLQAFDPIVVSLLTGKITEVKPGITMQLKGSLDFSISFQSESIIIKFKIAPEIVAKKFFKFYGDLTGVVIRKTGIYLQIDGLPDVFLEAVS